MKGTSVQGNSLYQYYFTASVIILTILWYFRSRKTNKNTIPGPSPLPLIGNAHQIGLQPHKTFMKWAKIYGPLTYLKIPSEEMVVVNDPIVIKEVYSDQLTSGRMGAKSVILHEATQGSYGLTNTDGEAWEAQRKFTIRTLREFGFGKGSMEGIIMAEVNATLDWLGKSKGTVISANNIFNGPLINILWAMVSGKRCDWANEKEAGTVRMQEEALSAFQQVVNSGLHFAPILRFILPKQTGWTRFRKAFADLSQLFEGTVQDHKKSLDKSNLRDFIDYYLKEIEETTDEHSSFYKDTGHKNLIGVLSDLLLAGSITVSGTLSWCMLYISTHQEIQKKVQKEIDQVIGSSRSPTLLDRASMPYTEAVIFETLRTGIVTPIGGPHRATGDMIYKGHLIKENTTILANIYGTLHDPDIWGDPDNFRPERFLNEDGTQVIRRDTIFGFSEGKRKCLGKKLAEDEMFLFITGILQKFNIIFEPNKEPNFEEEMAFFMRSPKPFKIVIMPRNEE